MPAPLHFFSSSFSPSLSLVWYAKAFQNDSQWSLKRNCSKYSCTFDVFWGGNELPCHHLGPATGTLLKQEFFCLQVTETSFELPWGKQELYWLEYRTLKKNIGLNGSQGSQGWGYDQDPLSIQLSSVLLSESDFSLTRDCNLLPRRTGFWHLISSPWKRLLFFSKFHFKIPRKGPKGQPRSNISSREQRDRFYNWQSPIEQHSFSKERSSSYKRRTVLFLEEEQWCWADKRSTSDVFLAGQLQSGRVPAMPGMLQPS